MSRYSIRDVRASYTPVKAREEWYGDWMSALVYRPISFWITPIFLNLSVTASQVTTLGLLIALALPLLAFATGHTAYIAVAVLAIVFVILDCVDGNIARVTRTASKKGHYLDFLTDIVFRIALYGAVGILADREVSSLSWMNGQGVALALLAAMLAIVGRLTRLFVRQLAPGDVFDADQMASGIIDKFIFPFLSGLDRVLPLFVLAADRWGGLRWVILWLVGYSAADFLFAQYAIFRRLGAAS